MSVIEMQELKVKAIEKTMNKDEKKLPDSDLLEKKAKPTAAAPAKKPVAVAQTEEKVEKPEV